MNTLTEQITTAKNTLKKALATRNGDTKHPEVMQAINNLSVLNPTTEPVHNESLLQGNWLLINAPNFPNRLLDAENRYVYTLGRLAFNMFEPINLKVAIEKVSQPVFLTDNTKEYTHNIVVEFKTIEPNIPEIKGIIKNLAVCHPVDKDTVRVQFTGGEIAPIEIKNSPKMQQWLTIFGNEKRSRLTIAELINSWLLKFIFGLSQASLIDNRTGQKSFTMKKSPKGLLKILYLDEELRITKGNKETILVCQRQ